jgi:hypothetical protein
MDMKQWRDLASDYIEGTLPPDKAREVREFLAKNPEAQADEKALWGLQKELEKLPEVDSPLYFAENVIARIQREQEAARQKSWRAWLPKLGRAAVGSLAVGGILAAAAWKLLTPPTPEAVQAGLMPAMPGKADPKAQPMALLPALKLANVQVKEASVECELALENAPSGSVSVSVPGVDPTKVLLGDAVAQARTVSVPVDETMTLASIKLAWTGGGGKGEQWILTPLKETQPETTRKSFGLGELPLTPQALGELAQRYGQTIVLEDVLQSDRKIRFDARNETLDALLTRHLAPLGMSVTRSQNRVVISGKH